MKTVRLFLFLLIFPLISFSQEKKHTTFTVISWDKKRHLDKKYQSGGMEIYNSCKVYFNNHLIAGRDLAYRVYLNHKGLDTIKLKGWKFSGDSVLTIVTKFKAGEHYSMNYNACSGYEIGPENRIPKTRLIRLILVNNDKKKRYFSSDYCFINTDTLQSVDTTYYYQEHISGYCEFATTSAGICKSDPEDYKIKDTCIWMNLQFLDTEKYSIIYDCKTQKISVKFDGYYDEKKDKIADDYVPK